MAQGEGVAARAPASSPASASGSASASLEGGARGVAVAWVGARELILLWSAWLLGSWTVIWWSTSPEGGARLMLFSMLLGLMWAWPALRLGHGWVAWLEAWKIPGVEAAEMIRQAERYAPLAVWLEWLMLVGIMQAVVWPLRLIAGWSLEQALWIDAALVGWSGLAATVVAWAVCEPGRGRRVAGMVLCVALVLAQPVWGLLVGHWPAAMHGTPVQLFWELGMGRHDGSLWSWAGQAISVGLGAVVGAVVTVAMGLWPRRDGVGSGRSSESGDA